MADNDLEILLMSGRYAIVSIAPPLYTTETHNIGVSHDELRMILEALDWYKAGHSETDSKRFARVIRERLYKEFIR